MSGSLMFHVSITSMTPTKVRSRRYIHVGARQRTHPPRYAYYIIAYKPYPSTLIQLLDYEDLYQATKRRKFEDQVVSQQAQRQQV